MVYTPSCNFLFTIILGDFNVRPSVWWTRDKTTMERTQLESLTPVHGFQQLISQPTHLDLLPQTLSCIDDLIFTGKPNLIVNSLEVSILHYIQTAIIRLPTANLISVLNIHLHISVWFGTNYELAYVEGIKKSIESVNWEVMFNNIKVFTNRYISIFNETLMNIFSNFTPNNLVTFADRDPSILDE